MQKERLGSVKCQQPCPSPVERGDLCSDEEKEERSVLPDRKGGRKEGGDITATYSPVFTLPYLRYK